MGKATALLLILASLIFGFTLFTSGKKPSNPTTNETPLEIFDRDVEILLAGDVMLGRSVMEEIIKVGDPLYPFREVAERLKSADLVFLNLENPITKSCPRHIGGFTFCTTPEIAEGLVFAGVDIVNLANNHTYNHGREGFSETKEILDEKGVKWVGDGNLEIITIKGTKFGFLGFDLTVKDLTESNLKEIRDADPLVDILIVAVHWGVEYTREPTELQKNQALQIVETGADVIAGHHPHWVQISEVVEGKPVYYSMGNFIFDQMWSEETKKGVAIVLTYRNGQLKETKEYPTYMSSWAQPHWVDN